MKRDTILGNISIYDITQSDTAARRKNGFRIMALGCTVLTMLLLWIVFPCSATCEEKSLFIDEKGNVGIGTVRPATKLDVAGNITGIGMVPPGAIVMFYGDINACFDEKGTGRKLTAYEGWQLCNGANGAPDLQERFVVGAGRNYKVADQGGADSITLTEAQMPAHQHGGNTVAAGNHYHDIRRNNGILRYTWKNGDSTTTVKAGAGGKEFDKGANLSTGIGGQHSHPIASVGGNQPHENRPPFFALAFIMRLAVSTNP